MVIFHGYVSLPEGIAERLQQSEARNLQAIWPFHDRKGVEHHQLSATMKQEVERPSTVHSGYLT